MKAQKRIAANLNLAQSRVSEYKEAPCDIILDAVFGIGLGREIGEYRKVLEMLESMREQYGAESLRWTHHPAFTAPPARSWGLPWRPDVTVTFGYAKTGLLLIRADSMREKLVVADIGFPEASLLKSGWDAKVITPGDLTWLQGAVRMAIKARLERCWLSRQPRHERSGLFFRSWCLPYGGRAGKDSDGTGKPAGSGPSFLRPLLAAMTRRRGSHAEHPGAECAWADVIVTGPGLGQEPYTEYLLETVLSDTYVQLCWTRTRQTAWRSAVSDPYFERTSSLRRIWAR